MTIPTVTFPLEQDQIKETYDRVLKHLLGLQADAKMTTELLKIIRSFCKHPGAKNRCDLCGADWDY